MRCLVAISQALAGLRYTIRSGSAIALRACLDRRVSSASHQRKACVCRAAASSAIVPGVQLFVRKRLIEGRIDVQPAQKARLAGSGRRERNQARPRLAVLRYYDLLPGVGSIHKLRELRLGLVDIDLLGHVSMLVH